MESMGIPRIAADLVTGLETAGGLLLIVGLITPVVGLFFVVEFASIIWMRKSKMHAVLVSMDPKKPTFEMDFAMLLLALVFLFLGAGPLSLDGLLGL